MYREDNDEANMTVMDKSLTHFHYDDYNPLNKSVNGEKKVRANRSVRADRAKSRQYRDPSEYANEIGYEVDLV